MTDAIRLKYFSSGALSIVWAQERPDYSAGDCYVAAIRATTPEIPEPYAGPGDHWSLPMSLEYARGFIAADPQMLGAMIHDCVGVVLIDDDYRKLDFTPPIQVRNRKAP